MLIFIIRGKKKKKKKKRKIVFFNFTRAWKKKKKKKKKKKYMKNKSSLNYLLDLQTKEIKIKKSALSSLKSECQKKKKLQT